MPKRAIPQTPRPGDDKSRQRFDSAVKENLEIITGQRVAELTELDVDASTSDIIAKVNEIIARLQ